MNKRCLVGSKLLVALAAFAVSADLPAQFPHKLVVVDVTKVYDHHPETVRSDEQLREQEREYANRLDALNAAGNALVDEYKRLTDQSKNATRPEARRAAEADAQKKMDEIQQKQREVTAFKESSRQSLQDAVKERREATLAKIKQVALEVAREKGATLVLDVSGPTLIGLPAVLYADATYDITNEVMSAVGATPVAAPASTPLAAAEPARPSAAPSAASAATPSGGPSDDRVIALAREKFQEGGNLARGIVLYTIKRIRGIEITRRGAMFNDATVGAAWPFKIRVSGTGTNMNTNFGRNEDFAIEMEAYLYQDKFGDWQATFRSE